MRREYTKEQLARKIFAWEMFNIEQKSSWDQDYAEDCIEFKVKVRTWQFLHDRCRELNLI